MFVRLGNIEGRIVNVMGFVQTVNSSEFSILVHEMSQVIHFGIIKTIIIVSSSAKQPNNGTEKSCVKCFACVSEVGHSHCTHSSVCLDGRA